MRFLTILVALIVGIVMGIVFINNGQGVNVNLDPFVRPRVPPMTPFYVFPLWAVMLVCVGIGFVLGWLLGITSGYTPRVQTPKPPPPPKKPEPDYLLIDSPAERRKL